MNRNKQLGFDSNGMPTLLNPTDTGALGYVPVGSFEKGATLTARFQVLFWEDKKEYFRWDGQLPKVVSSNSNPNTTGGVKTDANPDGLWVSVGDASLRTDLIKIKNIYRKYCVIPEYDFPDLSFSEAVKKSLNSGLPVFLLKERYELDKLINIPNAGVIIGRGKTKTIIECITANSGFYNDYGFNIQLKGFQLNGGNVAGTGLRLGSNSGVSAHHVLDDIQVYDFTEKNIHVIKGIYHHFTDSVYVTGGNGYGLFTESMDVSIIEGRYYNHRKGSVVITNGSNLNKFKGKVYNDIAFPSDYLMIADSSCGNSIGFDFEPQGENNVKASLIIDNVTGSPWHKSNMSDNKIIGNFLGLSKTSSEAHIIVGGNNAAYKTIIDGCTFLTLQNGLPDIKLVKQNNTKIINSVNNKIYDTPVLKDVIVLNISGNAYSHVKFINESEGRFSPSIATSQTQPTITSWYDSVGYYQLIGDRCYVDMWIRLAISNSGTGSVRITGLPLKQKQVRQQRASVSISNKSVDGLSGYVEESSNYVNLIKGTSALLSSEIGNEFSARLSFSYRV